MLLVLKAFIGYSIIGENKVWGKTRRYCGRKWKRGNELSVWQPLQFGKKSSNLTQYFSKQSPNFDRSNRTFLKKGHSNETKPSITSMLIFIMVKNPYLFTTWRLNSFLQNFWMCINIGQVITIQYFGCRCGGSFISLFAVYERLFHWNRQEDRRT